MVKATDLPYLPQSYFCHCFQKAYFESNGFFSPI